MYSLYIEPQDGDWGGEYGNRKLYNNFFHRLVEKWLKENKIYINTTFIMLNKAWKLRLDFENEEDLNFFRLGFPKKINQIQL